jgi:hypothetical protein
VPFSGVAGPGNAFNASYYVDPQVPGSSIHPNIAASRGFAEPALAGNALSPPQAYLNLNIEYPISKNATLGLEAFNITNNVYGVPEPNTLYHPVRNGVSTGVRRHPVPARWNPAVYQRLRAGDKLQHLRAVQDLRWVST